MSTENGRDRHSERVLLAASRPRSSSASASTRCSFRLGGARRAVPRLAGGRVRARPASRLPGQPAARPRNRGKHLVASVLSRSAALLSLSRLRRRQLGVQHSRARRPGRRRSPAGKIRRTISRRSSISRPGSRSLRFGSRSADSPERALLACRILGAAFVALAVFGPLRRLARTRPRSFSFAGLLLLALPGASESLARCANDGAIFLWSAAVLACLDAAAPTAVLCALLAAGPLLKPTAFPVVAVANRLALDCRAAKSRRRRGRLRGRSSFPFNSCADGAGADGLELNRSPVASPRLGRSGPGARALHLHDAEDHVLDRRVVVLPRALGTRHRLVPSDRRARGGRSAAASAPVRRRAPGGRPRPRGVREPSS